MKKCRKSRGELLHGVGHSDDKQVEYRKDVKADQHREGPVYWLGVDLIIFQLGVHSLEGESIDSTSTGWRMSNGSLTQQEFRGFLECCLDGLFGFELCLD